MVVKHSKHHVSWDQSPVGAELFNSDGRTDMTKLTVGFRNFANATKNFSAFPTRQNVTQTSGRKREPVLRSTTALNEVPFALLTDTADVMKGRNCWRLNLNGKSLRIMGILRTNTSFPTSAPPQNSAQNDSSD